MADPLTLKLVWDAFWAEGLKALLKPLWEMLVSLVFKDGKFSIKRAKWIVLWLAFAWVIYETPCWILKIPPFTGNEWLNELIELMNDHNYLQLSQYFLLSLFGLVTTLLALMLYGAGAQSVATLSEDDSKVINFVKDVRLISGSRCSTADEKKDAKRDIASKIENSNRVQIMVINGYHDLADSSSVIRQALEKKKRSLDLKVLLLDPFSEYSVRRAEQLLPEIDMELSRMRYIRDYFRTINSLDELKKTVL